jgi:hypothetical protein
LGIPCFAKPYFSEIPKPDKEGIGKLTEMILSGKNGMDISNPS